MAMNGTEQGTDEFATGDQVELKSGSPTMTVAGRSLIKGHYECQWFSGSKLDHGHLRPDTLVRVKEAPVRTE